RPSSAAGLVTARHSVANERDQVPQLVDGSSSREDRPQLGWAVDTGLGLGLVEDALQSEEWVGRDAIELALVLCRQPPIQRAHMGADPVRHDAGWLAVL